MFKLREVAFRILAIPASSCASERNFPAVARLRTKYRAHISKQNWDGIMLLRSEEGISTDDDELANDESAIEFFNDHFSRLASQGFDVLSETGGDA